MTADIATDGPAMLGPYRLEALLGRGGMGEVHRAFDTRRGRVVALKLLPAELAHDEGFRARFRREADSAARLQDPHVVPIHDFGEIDGRLFIDMRFIDGVGLDQHIAAGPMDPRRAVALIAQAAEALSDAHASAVFHRDVKPSNMIVTRSDFLYLTDFGIARSGDGDLTAITRSGATVGTPAYMAPERFDGCPPDARSDVYSLACTLAECLTGRRPFDATSLPSLMKAHLTTDPPRPSTERRDVPPAMDEVIARGMAKDPAMRYPTARDLAAAAHYAVQQWAQAPPRTAPAPAQPTRLMEPGARRGRTRVPVLVLGGAVLAVLAGVSGYALGHGVGEREGAAAASPADTRTAPATSTGPAPALTATGAAAPAPPVSVGGGRPDGYVYTVESNYPVSIAYTDSKGDQVQASSVRAPWRLDVDTAQWGADAKPMLIVSSMSAKGDTTVSCSITDRGGRVFASADKATAYASALCAVYGG